MVYSMLLDQVSAHFRSMNLLYEGAPTRQGGHEVVTASPKAVSTASPGEGSTSPAVLNGLSSGRRGDNAMTRTYREIAIEEMLRTVEEAMSQVINWWGDPPPPMKEAIEQFRTQLGAAIDSVEFVKRALDREVPKLTAGKAHPDACCGARVRLCPLADSPRIAIHRPGGSGQFARMRHYGCPWINHSRASDQWDETI
jgi:hypothetical protein